MIAARWAPSGIEAVESDLASLPEGWARLRVTGCGICGSDLHIYRGMVSGAMAPTDFAIPGHEIAGTIVDGPPGFADQVYAVEPWITCRSCVPCVRSDTSVCENGRLLGFQAGGGLAEYVDVPLPLLHPVDQAVDSTLASMAEPWAVAVRAVHRALLSELDERVLVLGGGNIGLLCGIAARGRAARVGITCRYRHQADLARRFGLEPIDPAELGEWSAEHRPGVTIETVGGDADTMTEAVASTRSGGRIVVVGVFGSPRTADYNQIVMRELEVVGSFIYGTVATGSEFGAAVRLMGGITEELAALQTHHFALADVAQAFAAADDKASHAVKVTIGG